MTQAFTPPQPEYIPRLEVSPPDISSFRRGNTGIDYVTTFDSGRTGPHVMVNALTHGNEICGAHALTFLIDKRIRPTQGKLTLSFANVEAFLRFDSRRPFDSRYVDEDFNRLWSAEVLDGPRNSRELTRARAMRGIVAQADYLLDLHSMHLPCAPLMLCGTRDKGLALARRLAYPRHIVRDRGHDAGRRMRDFAAFDDPGLSQAALLIECGQHWAASSVEVALQSTLRFLVVTGSVSADALAPYLVPGDLDQVEIEVSEPVTVSSPSFRFLQEYFGLEVIPKGGTLIAMDGPVEIRTPYDDCVLIMPARAFSQGLTAVRFGRIINR